MLFTAYALPFQNRRALLLFLERPWRDLVAPSPGTCCFPLRPCAAPLASAPGLAAGETWYVLLSRLQTPPPSAHKCEEESIDLLHLFTALLLLAFFFAHGTVISLTDTPACRQ